VAKKDDRIIGSQDDAQVEPVEPPQRASATETSDIATPRAARFGQGPEGRAARRERASTREPNFFERTAQFIRDVRAELRRVTWPTPNEVKNITIITLITVIFFAIYLFVVDQLFTLLITQLERLVNWLLGG